MTHRWQGQCCEFDLYCGKYKSCSLSAPKGLSLGALVTLDGFKCQCTENELHSAAVCHHWLMTDSHRGSWKVLIAAVLTSVLDT